MSTAQTFTALFTAQETTSAALARIRAQVDAVRGSMNNANAASGALRQANASGTQAFSAMATAVGRVSERVRGMASGFTGAIGAAAGLTGLGTTAALTSMATSAAEVFWQLDYLSKRINASPASLERLSFAFRQAGMSVTDMRDPLVHLDRVIRDMGAGRASADVQQAFRGIQISVRDTNGALRSVPEVFEDIVRAFERQGDVALRTALAQRMFNTSTESMRNVLERARDSYTRFENAGGSSSDERRLQLLELARRWRDIEAVVDRLRVNLGAAFAPAVTQVIMRMNVFVTKNRELISGTLEEWSRAGGRILTRLPFGRIGSSFVNVAKAAGLVVTAIGGIENAVYLVSAALAAALAAPALTGLAAIAGVIGGPLTIALVGVGLAAAAVYKWWDQIKAAGVAMVEALQPVLTTLADLFNQYLLGPLRQARDMIQSVLNLIPGLRIPPPLSSGGTVPPGEALPEPRSAEDWLQRYAQQVRRNSGLMLQDDPAAAAANGGVARAIIPQLPQPGTAANGQVEVTVNLPNVPEGATATVTTRGEGIVGPRLNVGRNGLRPQTR
jgi:hypothetical protein